MEREKNIIIFGTKSEKVSHLQSSLEDGQDVTVYEIDSLSEYKQVSAIFDQDVTLVTNTKELNQLLDEFNDLFSNQKKIVLLVSKSSPPKHIFEKYKKKGLNGHLDDSLDLETMAEEVLHYFDPEAVMLRAFEQSQNLEKEEVKSSSKQQEKENFRVKSMAILEEDEDEHVKVKELIKNEESGQGERKTLKRTLFSPIAPSNYNKKKGLILEEFEAERKKLKKFIDVEREKKAKKKFEENQELTRKKNTAFKEYEQESLKRKDFKEVQSTNQPKKGFVESENDESKPKSFKEIETEGISSVSGLEEDSRINEKKSYDNIDKEQTSKKLNSFDEESSEHNKKPEVLEDEAPHNQKKNTSFHQEELEKKSPSSFEEMDNELEHKKHSFIEAQKGDHVHKGFSESSLSQERSLADNEEELDRKKKVEQGDLAKIRKFQDEEILDYSMFKKQYIEKNLKNQDISEDEFKNRYANSLLNKEDIYYYQELSWQLKWPISFWELYLTFPKEKDKAYKFLHLILFKIMGAALIVLDANQSIIYDGLKVSQKDFFEALDHERIAIDENISLIEDESAGLNYYSFPVMREFKKRGHILIFFKDKSKEQDLQLLEFLCFTMRGLFT